MPCSALFQVANLSYKGSLPCQTGLFPDESWFLQGRFKEVCLCVLICIYAFMCVYVVHMCVCMCMCFYVYMSSCVYICMLFVCMYMCVHVCMRVCIPCIGTYLVTSGVNSGAIHLIFGDGFSLAWSSPRRHQWTPAIPLPQPAQG